MAPLNKLALELEDETSAEGQLQLVDQILQVTHARSDLASWFVEGGTATLSQLFHGMGLTELEKARKQGTVLAGKRDEATTSMTVGVDTTDFPVPLFIRWEQGMRWRQVLKTVKSIVGEV